VLRVCVGEREGGGGFGGMEVGMGGF